MKYWLLKSEPETYSWAEMKNEKTTSWTGVRNFQARNNIQSMEIGDQCFFYHSGQQKAIMGVVQIVSDAYKDPSDPKGLFYTIDVQYQCCLITLIDLEQIKAIPSLHSMQLLSGPCRQKCLQRHFLVSRHPLPPGRQQSLLRTLL